MSCTRMKGSRQASGIRHIGGCCRQPGAKIAPDLFSGIAQSSCAYDSHWNHDNPYEDSARPKSSATNWFVEPARQKRDRDAEFTLARTEGDPSPDCPQGYNDGQRQQIK